MPKDFYNFSYENTYWLSVPYGLLMHEACRRIKQKEQVIFIDPTGTYTKLLTKLIPDPQYVFLDPTANRTSVFNILSLTDIAPTASIVRDLLRDFSKFDERASTANFDQFILTGVHSLSDKTFLHLRQLFIHQKYRLELPIKNVIAQDFWHTEHLQLSRPFDEMRSVLNKLTTILIDQRIRDVISYPSSTLSTNHTVLAHLPRAVLGEDGTRFLGLLLLASIALTLPKRRRPLYVYLLDAHLYQGTLLHTLLTANELPISMNVAHHFLGELEPSQQASVLGNCGNKVIGRTNPTDGERLVAEIGANRLVEPPHQLQPGQVRLHTPATLKPKKIDLPRPITQQSPGAARAARAYNNTHYRIDRRKVSKYIRGVLG